MDQLEKIKILLERFYEGKTSLEEEQLLRRYFEGEKIHTELLQEGNFFKTMYAPAEEVPIPEGMNSRLIDIIGIAESRERRARRINIYSFSGLAASLVLILGVYLTFLKDNPSRMISQYTIEDPEVAYQEAKRALSFVSARLNSGVEELRPLDQVNKSMQSIAPLQKISSGTKELQLLGKLEKANDIHMQ